MPLKHIDVSAGEGLAATCGLRRSRASRRWIAPALGVVLVAVAAVAFHGRWVTVYDYRSGGMASTVGTGTESDGAEGPVVLSGRPARFVWQMNHGVVRIHVALVPVGASWPSFGSEERRPAGLSATEFSTTDRVGSWNLAGVPPGSYRVRYSWSTWGAETGAWSFRVEERLPWWRTGAR
jgi:hypothetical protein